MPALYQVETQAGNPILTNGGRILPFAKSLRVSLPWINFCFVWNRPISILMIPANGEEQVIPIRDRTREVVWTLYAAMAVLAAITAMVEFRKRGSK